LQRKEWNKTAAFMPHELVNRCGTRPPNSHSAITGTHYIFESGGDDRRAPAEHFEEWDMSTAFSKSKSKSALMMGAGLLVAIGMALAATPALADGKHKHWHDNGNHYGHYKKRPDVVYVDRYYDDGPDVVYVDRPVYVRERVYVEPRPVYVAPRPSINIVVPLFD
jgi:hypothetical protein